MPKFKIHQIALCPKGMLADRDDAIALLQDLGLTDWAHDTVTGSGEVFGEPVAESIAHLAFNYQGGGNEAAQGVDTAKPLELEVLHYAKGDNWMEDYEPRVSHLGMHVTEEELAEFHAIMAKHGIAIAQAIETSKHTNPVIDGKRLYKYVIYDTHSILGVDLKFIVRKYVTQEALGDLVAE